MQTKTYFANSVPSALEVARQELGQEALLVSSRPAPPHARQFGRLEVTFAWDPTEAAPGPPAGLFVPDGAAQRPPASAMDEIRQQLSELRAAVGGGHEHAPLKEDSPIAKQLLRAGFLPETAAEIAAAVKRDESGAAAVQEIARRMAVAPSAAMKPGESRTLAFIGPPGRGKTTSLIKVAVNLGIACRVPVRIYSAGAHGIGAQEQMARYAAILGTPWQSYESLAGLNLALAGDEWKGLALIDTPGISPADRSELSEFTSFFAGRTDIEKHLVLRADASSADMLHMLSRFSGLMPSRLFFTGLDEAVSPVPMIETLIRGGVPAGFAGTGQQIPEDLEAVNPERIARLAWTRGESAAKPARYALAAA